MAILGLLTFRILWGLFGSSTARFGQFVRGPRATWSYLRGRSVKTIGHNPLGALSVVALLLALAAQVVSGLLAVDIDGIESGPLSYLVDFEQGRAAAQVHALSFRCVQALVGLHVLAIAYYLLVRRRNLTGAMITGYETVESEPPATATLAAWPRLILALLTAAGLAWWIGKGARL